MLRISFGSGVAIRFIFMLGVFRASTGDFPAYRNEDSNQDFPNEINQFKGASSYPESFISHILAGTPLSLSFNVPAATSTITTISSTNQPGVFSNGFKSSFKPSVVKRDTASVSSTSTIKNTASASAGGVTAPGNTNAVSFNTYDVPPNVPVNTYLASPSAPINTYYVAPPREEVLAQSFSQALSSIPAVQNFLTVPISVSELSNIFYTKTSKVLVDIGHSDPHSLASRVSQPVSSLDVFTLPLLFRVIGKTLGKFLINEGVDISPNVSQLYSSYIEKYIQSNNVSNVDSIIEAVWYGCANFINALGFNVLDKSEYLTHLFLDEFSAFKN